MKKLILSLLLASMLLSAAACGTESTQTTQETAAQTVNADTPSDTDAVTEANNAASVYPDTTGVDLSGANVNMIFFSNEINHGWSDIPTDLNPAEETGDLLNDAVFLRNRRVEEMLNITLTEQAAKQGYDQLGKALQNSVMAGDDAYDLAFPNIVSIIGLADNGLLRDMNKMDLMLSAPWYDAKSINEMTILGKLFYVESDITFIDKLATIATYFNKNIASDYGMGDFYQLVADGGWTYDYMLKCAEQVSADIDGNGVMDANDVWGISCQNDGSYYLLQAAGLRISEKTTDSLRFSAGDERVVTTLQNIFDLMASDLYFNSHKFSYGIAQITEMYKNNRALFLIRPLQSVFNLREMEADFGIIPLAKYFESDTSYHSSMNIYPGIIMCVPKNNKNADYISTVIDVLAAESNQSVMPDFYNTVLGAKLTRDQMSSEMLDIIFASRNYDFGLIWDFGGFRTAITTAQHIDVASTVASCTPKAEQEIAELYQKISELD